MFGLQLWKYETDTAPCQDQDDKPKFETKTAKNRSRDRETGLETYITGRYYLSIFHPTHSVDIIGYF